MLCCIGKTISGTVHHECTATPTHVDSYRGIMRKRVMEAETPQRSVQEIGKSNQPMFVPGAGSVLANTGFSDFTVCICWCLCVVWMSDMFFIAIEATKSRQQGKGDSYATQRAYGCLICCI